jgi:DNA-directed RNA polymerase specialized sigma24 family protein
MNQETQPYFKFDLPGQARVEDPQTAKDAAAETHATEIEAIVLRAIEQADLGLTSEECAAALGLSVVTVSPRMRPLCRREKIRDSGQRRKNSSGCKAIVWVRA